MSNDDFSIERIRLNEYGHYKEARLNALKEDQYAFSTSYDDAILRDDCSWINQSNDLAESKDNCGLIVREKGKIIGLCALYRNKLASDEGELVQVWLNEKYRGIGISNEMIKNILEWARSNGIDVVNAKVFSNNERAIKFYLKYGFKYVNEIDNEKVLRINLK